MKKKLYKIIISIILFMIALTIPFSNNWINNICFVLSYLIVGFEILKKAFRNITRGNVFDENFLMSVATIGAFAIGEFPEAVTVAFAASLSFVHPLPVYFILLTV